MDCLLACMFKATPIHERQVRSIFLESLKSLGAGNEKLENPACVVVCILPPVPPGILPAEALTICIRTTWLFGFTLRFDITDINDIRR